MKVCSIAICAKSKWIVSGSEDNTIKVWDLKLGHLIHTFTGHKGSVESVAICEKSKCIVSGSCDMTIKVWNLTWLNNKYKKNNNIKKY